MVNRYPRVLRSARGLGFMQGLEFQAKESVPVWNRNEAPVSMQMVERLHAAGVLTIPSGTQILRLLPALNLPTVLADEALAAIEDVVRMVDGA
jgi:acetylornithine/succinyldiaminopimelate/putrescine aminotransferase